ncbi:MAG: hypothetical protein JWN69_2413 [Alphaproteobacteria bacterium]|nr:hypothetical protein [Alphaproteobacteria bacterium]
MTDDERPSRRPAQGREPGTRRWIPWTIGIVCLVIILYLAVRAFQYGADDRTDTRAPLPSADSDATGGGVGH